MPNIQRFNHVILSLLFEKKSVHMTKLLSCKTMERKREQSREAKVLPSYQYFCSTATHCFPYVKKRIAVMYQHHTDLSPIEVAIDEMSKKVGEIKQLCSSSEVDMIRLQLKLQGSISVQVPASDFVNICTNPYKNIYV